MIQLRWATMLIPRLISICHVHTTTANARRIRGSHMALLMTKGHCLRRRGLQVTGTPTEGIIQDAHSFHHLAPQPIAIKSWFLAKRRDIVWAIQRVACCTLGVMRCLSVTLYYH
ncbi:hypothetical protein BJY52DRAFT_457205 [Lactarius psammicola]|nr:hypothetical protein BJY52DRAFT_457205 [Lactarius psammicola]